jgi:hypothetical protein
MIVELKLTFKDTYVEGAEDDEPIEFVHTLSAPSGMEVTGGQIFIENPSTSDLQRFTFRVDRDENQEASLTILENVE